MGQWPHGREAGAILEGASTHVPLTVFLLFLILELLSYFLEEESLDELSNLQLLDVLNMSFKSTEGREVREKRGLLVPVLGH